MAKALHIEYKSNITHYTVFKLNLFGIIFIQPYTAKDFAF